MKPLSTLLFSLVLFAAFSLPVASAQSSVDTAEKWIWSGNLGWIDARPSAAHGAIIGRFYCRGNLWVPNAGWVSLGTGNPANGYAYSNATGTDFGVNFAGYNLDGTGRLRGLAWAANFGWIVFEDQGNPRINLSTGALSGHVWSANTGWITLGGFSLSVATNFLDNGLDTDGDSIPDAWERLMTGNLTTLGANNDADGDGVSDYDEWLAGTDPTDPNDRLRIVSFAWNAATEIATIKFTSNPGRLYLVETSSTLAAPWVDAGLGWLPGAASSTTTTRMVDIDPDALRDFFRVRVALPLPPP
jgi:hypothetical protein